MIGPRFKGDKSSDGRFPREPSKNCSILDVCRDASGKSRDAPRSSKSTFEKSVLARGTDDRVNATSRDSDLFFQTCPGVSRSAKKKSKKVVFSGRDVILSLPPLRSGDRMSEWITLEGHLDYHHYPGAIIQSSSSTKTVYRLHFTVDSCKLCGESHDEKSWLSYSTFYQPPRCGQKKAWVWCPRVRTQMMIPDHPSSLDTFKIRQACFHDSQELDKK